MSNLRISAEAQLKFRAASLTNAAQTFVCPNYKEKVCKLLTDCLCNPKLGSLHFDKHCVQVLFALVVSFTFAYISRALGAHFTVDPFFHTVQDSWHNGKPIDLHRNHLGSKPVSSSRRPCDTRHIRLYKHVGIE